MKWKTTVVLLVVTIAVGAYVSLYDLKQPTQERREALTKQVVDIDADGVTGFSAELPKGKVALTRQDGLWRLAGPLQARADESRIRRALAALDPLTAERVLEGTKRKPLAQAEFGLAPPRGTITVTMKDGKTTTVWLGEPTPVESNRYAALPGSPKIFIVSNDLFDELNQPADAYRSRELLAFETWNVTTIAVASQSSSYTLAKQGERWRLTAPLTDDADSAACSELLSKLRNLTVERFMADTPPSQDSISQWGFDQPWVRVTMTLDQPERPLELLVGQVAVDHAEQVYAKRSDEPTTYAVSKAGIEDLLKDPQTLRSPMLLEVFASQVVKAQVEWPDSPWVVEKVEGQWNAAGVPDPLDGSKVEAWLWKLRDTKLVRFVDDPAAGGAGAPTDLARYGLEPPKGRILVWTADEPQPRTLLIGNPIESGQTRYGKISGRTGIVELPEGIEPIVTTKPESFQPEPPPPTEPGDPAELGGRGSPASEGGGTPPPPSGSS